MATGTIVVIYDEYESSIKKQLREEQDLIECANKIRSLGLMVGDKDIALQPPFEIEHPFTFPFYRRNAGPVYTGKASGKDYYHLQFLVNRGWALIGNELVILDGELKEVEQLEKLKGA